jgi:hypothetical protein
MECPTHFWADIVWYRDFYDVPRQFCIAVPGGHVLFDSRFNTELDDYEPTYAVSLLRGEQVPAAEQVADSPVLAEIAVATVLFDATRRRSASVPRYAGGVMFAVIASSSASRPESRST